LSSTLLQSIIHVHTSTSVITTGLQIILSKTVLTYSTRKRLTERKRKKLHEDMKGTQERKKDFKGKRYERRYFHDEIS
jgi:hypothetical protein